MKFITNLIKRFEIREPKKILGRWNIDYCDNKLNNKIDWSNEDHCGPCGQYSLSKLPARESLLIDKNNKNNKNNTYNK